MAHSCLCETLGCVFGGSLLSIAMQKSLATSTFNGAALHTRHAHLGNVVAVPFRSVNRPSLGVSRRSEVLSVLNTQNQDALSGASTTLDKQAKTIHPVLLDVLPLHYVGGESSGSGSCTGNFKATQVSHSCAEAQRWLLEQPFRECGKAEKGL